MPVFCCGFECGVIPTSTGHWIVGAGAPAIDTTTFRSGLRSLRCNASGSQVTVNLGSALTTACGRFYIRFASLPSADCSLFNPGVAVGLRFKQSDSKLYCWDSVNLFGASGVSVTTGIWYRIDWKFISATSMDMSVDGQALGQITTAQVNTSNNPLVGVATTGVTCDVYFEDVIISSDTADYPLGDGYVLSYIPNADGTHNVAGANDFERTLTGTDITNATTDAYQLIDDRPLPTTAVDFINGVAPPNSTDYVEWQYEDSVENVAPRAVEAIIVHHDAGGAGTNNFTVTLREHAGGTSGNIHSGTTNVGATITYKRAHFATVPGTSDAWTLAKFNALRSRFLVSDASPDPYIDAAMLEAEYPGMVTVTVTLDEVSASLNVEQSSGSPTAEIDAVLDEVTASLNAEQRHLAEIDAVLVKVAAALSVVMVPDATISAVIRKVAAALSVEQRHEVTVASTLQEVTASINAQQEQRVTVTVTVREVQASIEAHMVPDAAIVSTIDEVQGALNAEQRHLMTIDSDLEEASAAVNAVMVPDATVTSTLDEVAASLNAQQEQQATVAATIDEVAAAISAEHRQLATVTTVPDEVSASLNVETSVSPEVTIGVTLDETQASLAAEQQQLVTLATTLDEVSVSLSAVMVPDVAIQTTLDEAQASLTAEQRQLATIASKLAETVATLSVTMVPDVTVQATLDEVSASLAAEQRQLATIATTLAEVAAALSIYMQPDASITAVLDEVEASLSAEHRQLATIVSTLAEMAASLNAEQQSAEPTARIAATLREIAASLNAEQSQLVTIGSTLDEVMASLSAEQRYLVTVGIILDEIFGSFEATQSQQLNVVTVLRAVAASLNAAQPFTLSLAVTLAEMVAALNVTMQSGAIVTTLDPVQAALRLYRILSRIDLEGSSVGSVGLSGVSDADLALVGRAALQLAGAGVQDDSVTLEGNSRGTIALRGTRA